MVSGDGGGGCGVPPSISETDRSNDLRPHGQKQNRLASHPADSTATRQLMRGEMRMITGCSRQQNVVLVEGFLSDAEIAHIDATPEMSESVEAGAGTEVLCVLSVVTS